MQVILRECSSVSRDPRLASINALFHESSLHRVTSELQRDQKVFARNVIPLTAKFKFPKRGMIERLAGQAVRIRDRGLHVILGQIRTGRRKIELLLPFGY